MSIKLNHFVVSFLAIISLCGKGEASSAKALGMGNATVAYPQDALTTSYNPALCVSLGDRTDFWISAKLLSQKLMVNNDSFFGHKSHAESNHRLALGSAALGTTCQVCPHVALGAIVYNRISDKTRFTKASEALGGSNLGRSYEQYCGSGVAAIRLGNHQVGLSLDLLVGMHKVNGFLKKEESGINTDSSKSSDSTLTKPNNHGYDWDYGAGITVGWLWNVTPDVRLGASFRPETKMNRFQKHKNFIHVPKHGGFHNPQQILAGFSWRFIPCATFGLDLEYVTTRHLFTDINPLFAEVENQDTSVPHAPRRTKHELVVRTGLDYAVSCDFIVRVGYIHQKDLERKSKSFWDIIYSSPIEHYVTAGATYMWNNQLDFDLFYEHGFKRGVKDSHAVPKFLGGGKVEMRKGIDRFGLGLGVKY